MFSNKLLYFLLIKMTNAENIAYVSQYTSHSECPSMSKLDAI